MLRFLTILVMFSMFNFANAQNSTKKLFKSYKVETHTLVIENRSNFNFEILKTSGNKIIVETEINIDKNEHILKALVKANRYSNIINVIEKEYNSIFIIKNNLPVLIMKDKEVNEWINIRILVPDYYFVKIKNQLIGLNEKS